MTMFFLLDRMDPNPRLGTWGGVRTGLGKIIPMCWTRYAHYGVCVVELFQVKLMSKAWWEECCICFCKRKKDRREWKREERKGRHTYGGTDAYGQ